MEELHNMVTIPFSFPSSVSLEIELQTYKHRELPDILLDVNEGIDYTGFQLWPGSILLSYTFLIQPTLLDGLSVLELGAGVGLNSLVASRFAKYCCITDGQQSLVDLIQENVLNNATITEKDSSCPCSAKVLRWCSSSTLQLMETVEEHLNLMKGASGYYKSFNLVYGSDLLYPDPFVSQGDIEPLLDTLDSAFSGIPFIESQAYEATVQQSHLDVFLMTYRERLEGTWEWFTHSAAERGWRISPVASVRVIKFEDTTINKEENLHIDENYQCEHLDVTKPFSILRMAFNYNKLQNLVSLIKEKTGDAPNTIHNINDSEKNQEGCIVLESWLPFPFSIVNRAWENQGDLETPIHESDITNSCADEFNDNHEKIGQTFVIAQDCSWYESNSLLQGRPDSILYAITREK